MSKENNWLTATEGDTLSRKALLEHFRTKPLTEPGMLRFLIMQADEERHQMYAPFIIHGAFITALVDLSVGLMVKLDSAKGKIEQELWNALCSAAYVSVSMAVRCRDTYREHVVVDPVQMMTMFKEITGGKPEITAILERTLPLLVNKDGPEALSATFVPPPPTPEAPSEAVASEPVTTP